MATGDSGREAYTAIAWGVGLSHERSDIAGAEGFHSLEGNMCGTARRGADALPRSKATSRAKGSHRNLGDLVSGRRRRVLCVYGGPHWEGEEPKPMMHGHEKSDLVIVAMKPANKAKEAHCGGVCGGERSGVGGAKGGGQGEYAPAQHVLDPEPGSRDKRAGAYTATFAVTHPRWEPYAGKPHVRLCVQQRLACSAGGKPAGATVRSPVVGIAGWRATKTLKPIDKVSLGEITSHRAVTKVNAQVASKMSGSEGRACN